MRQAGADQIILPSISGGRQMLAAIMHPIAYDFIQNLFYNQEIPVIMAEIVVWPESMLIGKPSREIWGEYNLNLFFACIKRDSEFRTVVIDREIIECGDILVVVGQRECIQKLAELANDLSQVNDLRSYCDRDDKSLF